MKTVIFIILSVSVIILSASCKKKEYTMIDPGWDEPADTLSSDYEENPQIKIMTYNIHSCYPVGASAPDIKGTADVIKNINPDIALLQEVDINTTNSGGIDQLATLSALTGMKYYYFGKAINFNNGEFGVGLLSKYKLEETNTTKLPLIAKQNNSDYVEQRVLAEGRIIFKGHLLTIATTHLDLTQYNREAQIPAIGKQLERSYPVILGGDFNIRPTNSLINDLQNLSYTFTSLSGYSISNYLIDYITYRPYNRFKLISQQVITSAGSVSDHYPVVAVLEIQ